MFVSYKRHEKGDEMNEKFVLIRKLMRKTQQEVAYKMGISLTAYRNKEKGRSRFFVDEIPGFSNAVNLEITEVINQIFFDNKVS